MQKLVRRDVKDEVNDTIISLLEQSQNLDFVNAWTFITAQIPHNPITETKYRGINWLYLNAACHVRKYAVSRWLTFLQVQQLKGKIKKGAKSAPVFYFSKIDVDSIDPAGNLTTEKKGFMKYYSVFNVAEIEGLSEDFYKVDIQPDLKDFEKNDLAEQVICSTGADIIYLPQNRAFYNRAHDNITLPIREQFIGAEPFYSTCFHELIHWTGAPTRLDREKGASFGDEKYALEELIAELGASYLCASLGFTNELSNQAAYIQSWLKALKNDKNFLFKASAKAQKAQDFILDNFIQHKGAA